MRQFLILVLIFLTGCISPSTPTPASFFDTTPAAPVLGMDSTSTQIQRAMIESAPQWMTLQMDGTSAWFAPNGDVTQAYQERVWLDPLNNRYKVEKNSAINNAEKFLKL